MSKKNNIRSFRYSDEVAEILENMEGASLNEKFENLVRTCYSRLPKIQSDIEMYEGFLDRIRKEYYEMLNIDDDIESIFRSVADLRKRLDVTCKKVDTICNKYSSRDQADCSENVLHDL